MAREIVATGDRLVNTSLAAVDTLPFTLACWFYFISAPAIGTIIGVHSDTSLNYATLAANSSNQFIQLWRDTGIDQNRFITPAMVANNWYFGAGVFSSLSSRWAYLLDTDGTLYSKEDTTTRTAVTLENTEVGRGTGNASSVACYIAEASFYNIGLSAAEIGALAVGYSPLLVRPDGLASYYRLLEQSATDGAKDVMGAVDLTSVSDPPIQSHPPGIIYPWSVKYGIPSGVAPPPDVIGPFPTFFHVP